MPRKPTNGGYKPPIDPVREVTTSYIGILISDENNIMKIDYLIKPDERVPAEYVRSFGIPPSNINHSAIINIYTSEDGDINPQNCRKIGSVEVEAPESNWAEVHWFEIRLVTDLISDITFKVTNLINKKTNSNLKSNDKYDSIYYYFDNYFQVDPDSERGFLVEREDESLTAITSTRQSYFSSFLEDTDTTSYDRFSKSLIGLSRDFRQEIAARLEPVLNEHIRTRPHDDLEGKKKIAEFVNSELERFGLAVQCPNTGLPGKLKASTGHWPGVGRFHFEVYVDGQRKMPAFSDTLPELKLIDATPAQVPEIPDSQTPWQDGVGPKSSRRGPKRS